MVFYFATPSGPGAVAAMIRGDIGQMVTPEQHNVIPPGVAWCHDNGCGPDADGNPGTKYPGDEKYLARLVRHAWAKDDCWFATAPDVLGVEARPGRCPAGRAGPRARQAGSHGEGQFVEKDQVRRAYRLRLGGRHVLAVRG